MSGPRTLDHLPREQWLAILDLAKGGDVEEMERLLVEAGFPIETSEDVLPGVPRHFWFPTIDAARAELARRIAPLFEGEKRE